jgi:hypothetical protein
METLMDDCGKPDITWSNQSFATRSHQEANLYWSGHSEGYPVGRLVQCEAQGAKVVQQMLPSGP